MSRCRRPRSAGSSPTASSTILGRLALEDAQHGELLHGAAHLAGSGEHDHREAVELVGEALAQRRRRDSWWSGPRPRSWSRLSPSDSAPAASLERATSALPESLGGAHPAAVLHRHDADDERDDEHRRDGRDDLPPAAPAPWGRRRGRRLEELPEAAPALAGEVGVALVRLGHGGRDLRADPRPRRRASPSSRAASATSAAAASSSSGSSSSPRAQASSRSSSYTPGLTFSCVRQSSSVASSLITSHARSRSRRAPLSAS